MRLYLMRHGQAARAVGEDEQQLTEAGKRGIATLARTLASRDISLQNVMHSGKRRAQQTAEIMARVLSPTITPVARKGLSPNDDPEFILSELPYLEEDSLIVGHLPYMPALLMLLPGDTGDMNAIPWEPGTIVCLSRINVDEWRFEWVAFPSQLVST